MADKPKQKQIGKTKGDLRRRGRIIAKAILDGKTETEACKMAGYSDSYAQTGQKDILNNPQIKATFTQIMDKAGLTDDALAGDIKRLSRFSKSQIVRGKKDEPDEVIEVEDGQVQLGAVKLAVQLKGHLVDKVSVDLDPISAAMEKLAAAGEGKVEGKEG